MVRPRDAVRSAPDVSRLSSRMASALRRAATARLRSTSVSLRMSLVGTVSTPRVSQPSPCCKSMIAGTPILAAAAAASTTSRRVEDGADVACRGCRILTVLSSRIDYSRSKAVCVWGTERERTQKVLNFRPPPHITLSLDAFRRPPPTRNTQQSSPRSSSSPTQSAIRWTPRHQTSHLQKKGNEEWWCGHHVAQAAKERHECATIPLRCLGEVLHLQLLVGMEAE